MIHIGSNRSNSSLTHIGPNSVQPNAIDLELDRVWFMNGRFSLTEDDKVHRIPSEIFDYDGYFYLDNGAYQVTFKGLINIGEDEAGFVITRSTLIRNGLFLATGLYDSGYSGTMASCLHVNGGGASIKKGTRIGQFLLWKAESLHNYNGSYGLNVLGEPKKEETRYFE